MIWDEELNERKKTILKSIIDDYVRSAQPIGSRTISKKQELGLSSATIRNEMSDLEELGYLAQPHASAGRIPSDKGYRFYVDNLMQLQVLAREEMLHVRDAMQDRIVELNDLVRRASSLISDMTGYTTMVITPNLDSAIIRTVQVIPVDRMRVLAVVVTNGGIVNNRMIRLDSELNEADAAKLNNMFAERLSGLRIHDLKLQLMADLEKGSGIPDGIVLPVLSGVRECMRSIGHSDVFLEGVTNLFNYPEFSDMIRTREIMELLREEEVVGAILKAAVRRHQLDLRIGSENGSGVLRDMSLVTSAYGAEEQPLGAIGVVGPTRMAYARVVASIDYVRRLLDQEIARMLADE